MKYLIIYTLCLVGLWASAQNPPAGQAGCDKEQLKTMQGKWLPQPKDAVGDNYKNPTAAEIAGAKKILNQIKQFFQDQYKPVGMDAYHHFHFMADESNNKNIYGNGSIYTIRNFLLVCVKGRKETSAEGVGSFVHINPGGIYDRDFSEIPIYDEYGKIKSGPGFYRLSATDCAGGKLPDFSKGYHIVEQTNSFTVWIGHEGRQPFRYVSRKEFLEKQVAICEAELKEKNKYYSSKGWKEMLENNPQSREDMLNSMKQILAIHELPLQAYRKDLKKDTAWLNEIAIVNYLRAPDANPKNNYMRYNFTTLDDVYMSVPIMPNPGYYNRSLPKWTPQFIRIDVREANQFISKNVRKLVEENIDFFKGLLVNRE